MGAVLLWCTVALYAESAIDTAVKTQAAMDSGAGPAWLSPTLPEDIQKAVQNKANGLAQSLKLTDETRQAAVVALLTEHYSRLWAWNQQVNDQLEAAWKAWEDARDPAKGGKDELKALTIMVEQIEPIYAQFAPQIHHLLTELKKVLREEQMIALLDRITHSPGVDRTYNAYLEMVPELKDEEKKVLRSRLEQARLESLAAWDSKSIIRIFKKYKIRNEFSIDDFGYNYRERYKAWVNQNKKT
jgi:hypothetical protein